MNSFRATGICPLNRSAIPDRVLSPSQIFRDEHVLDNEDENGENKENSSDNKCVSLGGSLARLPQLDRGKFLFQKFL